MENINQAQAEKAVDKTAHRAHETIDMVADAAKDASDNISDKAHDLKELEEKWLKSAKNYVRANPVKSIGIAAAGGYILSRIFSGRS